MVERRTVGGAGLLLSAILIVIGFVKPRLAGMLAEVIPITGINLVIPLPNLGDVVPLLTARGWVGTAAGILFIAFLTLAALNLATRVAERFQSS